MPELAVFEDLAELRDAVLILAGIAACVAATFVLLIVLKLSLTAYRIVRRLERFHDLRIAGSVSRADAQLQRWLEEDRWSARGMLELIQIANQRWSEWREPEPPPKRRLWGLLPPSR